MAFRDALPMRKQKEKPGPSGMSRNDAFALPEKWSGRNCLIEVDVDVVREIKAAMGGDELLEFVPQEFRERAEAAYATLHVTQLTFDNVWHVFKFLLPLILP